jgi:hypothetical protein
MCQDSQCTLRVAERVSSYRYFRIIVQLFFEEVQSQLKIFNDIVIVCTSLVMFHIAASKYLPVFRLQQFSYFLSLRLRLLAEPLLEETHLAINEHSMRLLGAVA